MLTDLLYVVGAALALFLVGANAAFLFNLGSQLTSWFTFKIVAIVMVLAYMSLSLFYGDPGAVRAGLGVAALALDLFALFWMWIGIERMKRQGVTGMIPIARIGSAKSSR